MNSINNYVVQCHNLCKSYIQADSRLQILSDVSLNVNYGETISIVGSSGSGKSTLLHILATLDNQFSGEVVVAGHSLQSLDDDQLCRLRNDKLGFIYQFHHLLPEFSAYDNVVMPILIGCGVISKPNKEFALHLLDRLGIFNRNNHYPSQLSGGERQRVAIARAVINNPQLVFADEPTGNLDNYTANQVLDILLQLQQELKTSVIIVTHDPSVASKAQTHYRLHGGGIYLD